jgi:hypothetical protein
MEALPPTGDPQPIDFRSLWDLCKRIAVLLKDRRKTPEPGSTDNPQPPAADVLIAQADYFRRSNQARLVTQSRHS